MDKIKKHQAAEIALSPKNKSEAGFSYIEIIISMVLLTFGLLSILSAMTFAMLYGKEAEKKTQAKEFASSIVENIFAIRDIQSQGGLALSGWDSVQIKKDGNAGIFVDGWFPVREGAGTDGIYGTTDDSCTFYDSCAGIPMVAGYERKIEILNIVENGVVRKRTINVSVRYRTISGAFRQETISTIIANLPFN